MGGEWYAADDVAGISLQLPAALRAKVEARAAESGFATIEAYVQALLLADAAAGPVLDDDQLETLLTDRLDGPFVDADAADFQRMREKLRAKMNATDHGTEPGPGT